MYPRGMIHFDSGLGHLAHVGLLFLNVIQQTVVAMIQLISFDALVSIGIASNCQSLGTLIIPGGRKLTF